MQSFSNPNIIGESIYFDYSPPPTYAGHINRHPFRVIISSSNDNDHYIDLNSKYSKSYIPQDNTSKWSFLRPECSFYDLSGNKIKSIKTIDTPIYLSAGKANTVSGTFVGVSGYAEFYFIDDLYNFDSLFADKPYSLIVATLQTSGVNYVSNTTNTLETSDYTNSLAVALQPHVFYYRQPDYIKISENGIRDFINPRWASVSQPVIFNLNWKKYPETFNDGNEVSQYPVNSNFCKSHPNSSKTDDIFIDKGIGAYNPNSLSSQPLSAYFKSDVVINYQDNNGYKTPGYAKNYFYVPQKTTLGVSITASTNFYTPDLKGNNFNPKMWIANTQAGSMSVVEYNFPNIFKLEDTKKLQKAQLYTFDVPIVENPNFQNDPFATGGFHGINSICVLPPPNFQAWACDGELNYLYKFSTNGQILCAIDLSVFSTDNDIAPASISLDSKQNIWMTFYGTLSVLKFDKEGILQFGLDNLNSKYNFITPTEYVFENEIYPVSATDTLGNVSYDLQYDIQPTYLDTDLADNVWVTYSNYNNGKLIKYDTNGNILADIEYPVNSCPQDVIVDNENNLWIALSNNVYPSNGYLEKRDSMGNLLSSFGPFRGINNLTLDPNQNLWFTYSYSRIGSVNIKSGLVIYTDNVLNYSNLSKNAPTNLTKPEKNTDETALEGITCDLKGYVYVINSIENKIYIFDSNQYKFVDSFFINPQGFTFYTNGENQTSNIQYNLWQKSAQAYGDWMGTKWLNKYYKYGNENTIETSNNKDLLADNNNIFSVAVPRKQQQPTSYVVKITGSSTNLDFFTSKSMSRNQNIAFLSTTFYKFIHTKYDKNIDVEYGQNTLPTYLDAKLDAYKVNENFDLTSQIKAVTFMPNILNNSFLFETFLPSIFGIYPYPHDALGTIVYEKISNFVKNNNDIDTCGANQLYSLTELLGEDNNDYRLNYPSEINYLVDLLSINQSRLWGAPNQDSNYFDKASKDGVFNRGNPINSSTYFVTAGVPIILKTKSLNKYELVQTGLLFDLESKITKLLNNFKIIISDKTKAPKTFPSGPIKDSSYQLASQSILNFKPQLQQQIVDYVNYYYPNIISNNTTLQNKCYRDTGFIIDAIAADIANNANHRSIDVSDIYFRGTLGATPNNNLAIPLDQLQPTVQAISALNIYINGKNIPNQPIPFTTTGVLSSFESGQSRKSDVSSRIDDIIYTLTNNGEKRDYKPSGTPTPQDTKLAFELLDLKTQAQSAVSAYVRNKGYINYFPRPDPTLTAKCTRDIGLIVDAVVNDLATGVDSRSIEYALAYWDGSTSRLPDSSIPNQRYKTIDTINFINQTILDICQNQNNFTFDQAEKIANSLNNFNQIISSLNNTPPTVPSGNSEDPSYAIASQRLLKYKPQLQQQVVDYAKYYYPYALSASNTLSAKCFRDTGFIIDAIAADIANNANHRSIEIGNLYFKGTLMGKTNPNSNVPTLPKDQIQPTIVAINSLRYYINGLNIPANPHSFTLTGILSSADTGQNRRDDVLKRLANIVYPIQNNGLLNSYIPNGNPTDTDIFFADFIFKNRSLIQNKVAQYVYDKGYLTIEPPVDINVILFNKCIRDLGYMVDAVASDLFSGVTSKTIQYALAYWDGSTSRIPNSDIPNQISNTLDTIDQLNNYLISNAPDSLLSLTLSTYPLQFLVNFIGLNSDLNQDAWQHYYEFYEYIPTTSGLQQNNIIDFDNPLTTLSSEVSSVYDWLGHEQLSDVLFSYNLYKGLGIID
jgi:hypothetical protein